VFTGIVEEVGTVVAVEPFAQGRRITVRASAVLADLRIGDSIALDGVCQTVVARDESTFTVEAIRTTLARTTLGEFGPGRPVNLERPVAAGGRFGGHFVQGHVDGVGTVVSVRPAGETVLLAVELPEPVRPVTILHGSLTLDGVALTVNALPAPGQAEVALIPYTYRRTNLSRLRPGDRVNVEGDCIGKYVQALLLAWRDAAAG
jgi:riboflavin synthase